MASRNIVMLGSGLGLTILSNGKGHFRLTNRNDQAGQNGPPSNLVPNIPVGPNRNGPSHLMYQPKFLKSYVILTERTTCISKEKFDYICQLLGSDLTTQNPRFVPSVVMQR